MGDTKGTLRPERMLLCKGAMETQKHLLKGVCGGEITHNRLVYWSRDTEREGKGLLGKSFMVVWTVVDEEQPSGLTRRPCNRKVNNTKITS